MNNKRVPPYLPNSAIRQCTNTTILEINTLSFHQTIFAIGGTRRNMFQKKNKHVPRDLPSWILRQCTLRMISEIKTVFLPRTQNSVLLPRNPSPLVVPNKNMAFEWIDNEIGKSLFMSIPWWINNDAFFVLKKWHKVIFASNWKSMLENTCQLISHPEIISGKMRSFTRVFRICGTCSLMTNF